jgi:predicted DNA-binding transcriptional regulator AlpA
MSENRLIQSAALPQAAPPLVLGLRPKDAARALGISPRTLWTLTNMHQVPCVRLGKAVIYPGGLLEKWLEERAKGARP